MTELSELSPRERAKRYRELAREARRKATQCLGNIQTAFLKCAGKLEQLALEADEEANSGP
jgi:hypothetical protein